MTATDASDIEDESDSDSTDLEREVFGKARPSSMARSSSEPVVKRSHSLVRDMPFWLGDKREAV